MTASQTLAQQLADFIVSAELSDVDEVTVRRVQDDVVDIVGCVLLGHRTRWGQAVVRYVRSLGEPETATVWGTGYRASAGSAALALGILGHSLDFDDYHAEAKLHPATVVLPAAFSLGESIGSSGTDVLMAGILGFETMIRLSLAAGPVATMLNGFHLTGICGSVGAAAAAARLLRLTAAQTADALGLAATQSAGLMGFLHDGSETKRLHAGRSAQSGILAARLAQGGFTGPPRVFELEHGGFCHAFSTDPRPERMLERLGERWTAGETSFKRYSCCGSIHSTLDLVGEAAATLGVKAADIDRIVVGHSPVVIQQCGWDYEPSDALHAQMSIKYCVAALLVDGAVQPAQFAADRLADPELLAVAERVDVVPDATVERLYPARFASRVTVHAGGRECTLRTEHPKGAPESPLSTEEVDQKFRDLASEDLPPGAEESILRDARRLAQIGDIGEIVRHLRGGSVD